MDRNREGETLAWQVASAGWQVVAEVRSRAGVELRLHLDPHLWHFSRVGQRFAYGRDDQDAMRRFLRQLDAEQAGTGMA